jgi:hypothetical protein
MTAYTLGSPGSAGPASPSAAAPLPSPSLIPPDDTNT